MKNYYLLLFLFIGFFGKAQIINFPDANFKAKLLAASPSNAIAKNLSGTYFKIDANNNGEIEISEALQVKWLNVSSSNISSLLGLNYFINIETLGCSNNLLTSLDLTNLNLLDSFSCNNNQLISLTIDDSPNLHTLNCQNNLLTNLNLNNLNNLSDLNASNNQLTNLNLFNININSNIAVIINLENNNLNSLDVSNLEVADLNINLNSNLSYVNIKNGWITSSWYNFQFYNGNSNLKYICVDEEEILSLNQFIQQNVIPIFPTFNCQVNSYCSFTPGGQFYTIQGQQKLDNEIDGCDLTDSFIPNFKYSITDGTTTGSIISDNTGSYSIPVQAGSHAITPILENPSYFTVSPQNVVVNFPSQSSPVIQNFCITPNGTKHDVEVSIVPISVARPGFDSTYKIIYNNKGNQIESGTINLQFDDAVLDLVSTNPAVFSQTINNLNWTYSNLQPFETREINLAFNVNSPIETPAVNAGDFLIYSVEITQMGFDEVISDNSFGLKQIVVNSFDPNDKTCLEGNYIGPDRVGGFVHYMIRFENTGTFPAENIVVKDVIDTNKFDVSSLVLLQASHNCFTRMSGNKVEFIFENINLPFDDANNDGYVAFKIKTLPTLVIGNTFSNSANIYFDYNFPIVTNTATTNIVALSNPSFEFTNYFSLYPNPTTSELNINLKSAIEINSIQIYNTIGQLVTVQTGNALKVDVSHLKTGNYFIKINTNEGFSTSQFIKE